jgi:hypothetical protein
MQILDTLLSQFIQELKGINKIPEFKGQVPGEARAAL